MTTSKNLVLVLLILGWFIFFYFTNPIKSFFYDSKNIITEMDYFETPLTFTTTIITPEATNSLIKLDLEGVRTLLPIKARSKITLNSIDTKNKTINFRENFVSDSLATRINHRPERIYKSVYYKNLFVAHVVNKTDDDFYLRKNRHAVRLGINEERTSISMYPIELIVFEGKFQLLVEGYYPFEKYIFNIFVFHESIYTLNDGTKKTKFLPVKLKIINNTKKDWSPLINSDKEINGFNGFIRYPKFKSTEFLAEFSHRIYEKVLFISIFLIFSVAIFLMKFAKSTKQIVVTGVGIIGGLLPLRVILTPKDINNDILLVANIFFVFMVFMTFIAMITWFLKNRKDA